MVRVIAKSRENIAQCTNCGCLCAFEDSDRIFEGTDTTMTKISCYIICSFCQSRIPL